jgi:anti-sigma regulatory factor (Ser/Thr protein kinase)
VNDAVGHIEAAIRADDDAIGSVQALVDRVGRSYGLPPDTVTDLQVALDEVVTNIVHYAHPDGANHEFTVRFEMRGTRLQTVVEDDGVAFDPLAAPAPDLSLPLEKRRVGGLGVHFVKNLMSAVRYERVGERNRLTLEQELKEGNA